MAARARLRALAAAALCVTGLPACSERGGPDETVLLGTTRFVVPRHSRIYFQAAIDSGRPTSDFLAYRLCEPQGPSAGRPPGCVALDELPLGRSVRVLILAPRLRGRFDAATERPAGAAPPPKPLARFADVDRPTGRVSGAGGDYALDRMRLINPIIFTTHRQWPLVVCDPRSVVVVMTCGVTFRVRDTLVEVSWSTQRDNGPDQAQAWRIATAIDDFTRRLIR